MVSLEHIGIWHGPHCVLRDVTVHIAPGSMTALMGPNGAGKSSLLRCIAGLQVPSGGRVHLQVPRGQIAYLAQRSETERDFPISVFDCVLLGCWPRMGTWRGTSPQAHAAVHAALDRLGLAALAQRPIAALSEGQWQRVLFARMLVQDARLLLLDEPFSALDESTTQELLQLLHQWHAEGRTLVVALHDRAQAQAHFAATLQLQHHGARWRPAMAEPQPPATRSGTARRGVFA